MISADWWSDPEVAVDVAAEAKPMHFHGPDHSAPLRKRDWFCFFTFTATGSSSYSLASSSQCSLNPLDLLSGPKLGCLTAFSSQISFIIFQRAFLVDSLLSQS